MVVILSISGLIILLVISVRLLERRNLQLEPAALGRLAGVLKRTAIILTAIFGIITVSEIITKGAFPFHNAELESWMDELLRKLPVPL